MRPHDEYTLAMSFVAAGWNDCQVARATGIPRRTIRDWRVKGAPGQQPSSRSISSRDQCPICGAGELDPFWYAYLLGVYLGDGYLSLVRGGVYRLRISLDAKYPRIIEECVAAVTSMRPQGAMSVGRQPRPGCEEVWAHWKHWACVFPQHGPGRKHEREIKLEPWQADLVRQFPQRLLRGLIQSDGCRVLNRVNGTAYSRYHFTNNSDDIRGIFGWACDEYGVAWRQSNWKTISVSKRPDVARLDEVIGTKLEPADDGSIMARRPVVPRS